MYESVVGVQWLVDTGLWPVYTIFIYTALPLHSSPVALINIKKANSIVITLSDLFSAVSVIAGSNKM